MAFTNNLCPQCGGSGETKSQADTHGWVPGCDVQTCNMCWGGDGWISRCPEAIRKAVEDAEKQFPTLREQLEKRKN